MPTDKLFVRDVIERLQKLDPRLLTNVTEIKPVGGQDSVRVEFVPDSHPVPAFDFDDAIRAVRRAGDAISEAEDDIRHAMNPKKK